MPNTKFKQGQKVWINNHPFTVGAAFFDVLSGGYIYLLVNPSAQVDALVASALFGSAIPPQLFAAESEITEE